ncbi:hypothetical protein [Actinobacillus pleuropneumoniae]|uniref:hypothetical protein n=1 Tax=Actinobacillus pleuropneumoniae TaxID=715 RepID=UPI00223D4986|nr:hypothetical protein [Actinobacillus pleuropneumoniae]
MKSNLLTAPSEQISEAIKLLEAILNESSVVDKNDRELSQAEIISTVVQMLKGNCEQYTEELPE